GVLEQARDVREALDVGHPREVEIAAVRLRLARERLLEVVQALRTLQALARHVMSSLVQRLMVTGAPGSAPRLRRRAPAPGGLAAPAALAVGTAAVEFDAMMRDPESTLRGHPSAEGAGVGLGVRSLHVADAPAAETGEVVVLGQVAVEAGVRPRQLLDEPLRDQQPEVAVHGAEAHPRQAAAHHAVHPLRGGVGLGGPHHLQDQAARPGEPEPAGPQGGDGALAFRPELFRNGSHYGSGGYRGRWTLSSATASMIAGRRLLKAPGPSSRLSISGGVIECPSRGGSASREPGRTT